MAGYRAIQISGNETGLVQERENFLLPNDAYPTLNNAYVWRERIKRKQGYELLGRLQRQLTTLVMGVVTPVVTDGSGNLAATIINPFPLNPGIASFQVGTDVFTDWDANISHDPINLLTNSIAGTATLNRSTGTLTINNSIALTPVQYFPGLPVMGIRQREEQNSAFAQTVIFDENYAYVFNGGTSQFQEFIPGTTWNASSAPLTNINFFWTTNYFVDKFNAKIFWATNYSGVAGDPIRFTSGTSWFDFAPQIDASSNLLNQCLALLPFRGRLVAFNTLEGTSLALSKTFSNRIRWAAIGTPFTQTYGTNPPMNDNIISSFNANSWRSDIRGKGGFLDIPTSEDIISVGFVRDNLVIYCERSTWQLRYTGRTIAPFQIEKVNSENGVEGTFSTIQFDTTLVGLGDKGILECDSFKAELIDIKIPDFVYNLQSANNGTERVHGIRDFQNRLAYWIVPTSTANGTFPDQRLLYNYENDSWATFNDSLTCLGTIQAPTSRTWVNTPLPWVKCNFPWTNQPFADPEIIGGNQQGFVEYLDELTTNDISLYIQNIVGNTITPTIIYSPNHNMQTGFFIEVSGIPIATPFSNLNDGIFKIVVIDKDNFELTIYNPLTGAFDAQLDPPGIFQGIGFMSIRENFSIISKKFNFMDEGQSIQIGYLDVLMSASENQGAISLNVYLDYQDSVSSNTLPKNTTNDTFFNSIIPTTQSTFNNIGGTKFWQRVFCPTRANFITLEYKFSDAQMVGVEQENDVQIDSQTLWVRPAGRLTQL